MAQQNIPDNPYLNDNMNREMAVNANMNFYDDIGFQNENILTDEAREAHEDLPKLRRELQSKYDLLGNQNQLQQEANQRGITREAYLTIINQQIQNINNEIETAQRALQEHREFVEDRQEQIREQTNVIPQGNAPSHTPALSNPAEYALNRLLANRPTRIPE